MNLLSEWRCSIAKCECATCTSNTSLQLEVISTLHSSCFLLVAPTATGFVVGPSKADVHPFLLFLLCGRIPTAAAAIATAVRGVLRLLLVFFLLLEQSLHHSLELAAVLVAVARRRLQDLQLPERVLHHVFQRVDDAAVRFRFLLLLRRRPKARQQRQPHHAPNPAAISGVGLQQQVEVVGGVLQVGQEHRLEVLHPCVLRNALVRPRPVLFNGQAQHLVHPFLLQRFRFRPRRRFGRRARPFCLSLRG
mmetsp:Transcript_24883/g.51102  ORF Transcript_24883/g.51102 Transcript_24883/m.51102 type:complete len:249 (-) Transcript_24883:78-824(-)